MFRSTTSKPPDFDAPETVRNDWTFRTVRANTPRIKLLAVGFAALVIGGLLVVWVVASIGVSRAQRLDYQNKVNARIAQEQLRDAQRTAELACAIIRDTPPGDDIGDTLRSKYSCPPYTTPTTRPTPSGSTTP